ncbi:MAG: hypothetical protein AB7U66_17470, partial [Hyphomicrobiaceae bacterium]
MTRSNAAATWLLRGLVAAIAVLPALGLGCCETSSSIFASGPSPIAQPAAPPAQPARPVARATQAIAPIIGPPHNVVQQLNSS